MSTATTSPSTSTSANSIPRQRFKYDGYIESQHVHYDDTWKYYYSCLDDLQENFPGAKQFRVQGDIILFLRDENNKNKRHDPPRIAHYPDDVIEIFSATRSPDPNIASGSVFAGIHTELQPHLQAHYQSSPQPCHVMSPSAEIVAVLSQSEQGRTILRSTPELRAASNITAEIRPVQCPTPSLLMPSLIQPAQSEENPTASPSCSRPPSPRLGLAQMDHIIPPVRVPSPQLGLVLPVDHVVPPARTPSPRPGVAPVADSIIHPARPLTSLTSDNHVAPPARSLTPLTSDNPDAIRVRSPSPRPPPLRPFPTHPSTSHNATSSNSCHHSPSTSFSSNTSYATTRPATPPPAPLLPPLLPQPCAAQVQHQPPRFHTPKTPMSPHFSALFSRASADPVTLKKEIEEVNFRISTATDPKSENYGDLLKYLSNLIHQQNTIMQQNNQYQSQQHQHTHHLQNHALSKLDVMDRKLDAILVQNYELHEYTIPRFFVVLPESFDKWDPRSLMMGKYRLYFLCECDVHSTECHGISSSSGPRSPATPSPHRRVHLHNHKGYSFSRPNEFLERFGPYVLGMLKVLSYCLRAATIAAPATGLIKEAVQDAMQGIEAIAKNTLENIVSGSISFLKQKLDDGGITASSSSSSPDGFDLDDPFQSVVGLEGADLRRLRTFLRYNDGDETLGNLYRTTTIEGHVKWVCLRHHRQSYRDATMLPFLKMLRENNGEYDPYLRKVSITLTSSAAAKIFFDTLATRASAVDELDVVLDWSFWPSDLELLVKAVFQSSIKSLKLDLKDPVDDKVSKLGVRIFSKNKYQPLLDLLCNKRLQGLSISGAGQFGLRTSDFPVIQNFSSLRSFHFLHRFRTAEQQPLMKILTCCPNLADLRLGDYIFWSKIRQELAAVIAAMTQLRTLHLYGVRTESGGSISGILSAFAARGCLKELVCYVGRVNERELSEAIRNLSRTLEVLVVEQVHTPLLDLVPAVSTATAAGGSGDSTLFIPGLLSSPSSPTSLSAPFSRLTHLDLNAQLTRTSIDFLASALMDLNLVHLGITSHTKDLLNHVNFHTLRSISLLKFEEADLSPLFDFIRSCNDHQCQLETLSLLLCSFASIWPIASLLSTLALKRLQLSLLSRTELKAVLDALNLSRLEVLMLVRCQYDWTTEEILAVKQAKFTRQLMLHLCLSDEYQVEGIHKVESRARVDTQTRLAARRVRFYSSSNILLMEKPLLGII